jgi:hypothetical protein
MRGIPCEKCGWNQTTHEFPELYPQCAHRYVPAKHLKGLDDNEQDMADRPATATEPGD